MKMSSAPSYGAPRSLILGVAAFEVKNGTLYQPKVSLGYPQKSYEKKI
jgi:hypothetical protein